ncbi:response regulator [Methylocapsa acidiphila]|uniref:response regulator n=1 Tax=Methylocapsa acidiphila TaxID=133552 RepID=UPI0003F68E47|nr:response regulator [Methylocapsa acidiphila]
MAKIVLVDDDLPVLGSLQFMLEAEGFDVDVFESGATLLLQPVLPDKGCFVIDYHLPEMDGLELLARLRDRRCVLPAILITGDPDQTIEHKAAGAGVLLVLRKPHLGDGLIEGIRKALRDH